MKIFFSILTFLTFFSQFSFSRWDTNNSIEEISQSKQWLKLMHYQKSWLGKWESQVDGPSFFFAKDGKFNPQAELIASLEAMSKDIQVGKLKQHPQCAFPFRYRFLQKAMGLNIENVRCEKLDAFIEGFNDPKSLSIVYSSAYPNNPASMFGHLLIKVNSERNNPLLDSGINYAASVPGDENAFAFFYFGVFGGYYGSFTHQPYYVKVNEYVNFESRDLWEYELSFTKQEVINLLYHIWEVETNSYYWYYFFDENCAFQIMDALEVIRPNWNISDFKVAVVPGEMVKNLAQTPGAVANIHFRPSHYKQARQVLDALNVDEKKDFLKVINKEVEPQSISHRLSLDASIRYIEFIRNEKKSKFKKQYKQFREKLLSARAKLGALSEEERLRLPEISRETQPDKGHDVAVLVGSYGVSNFSDQKQNSEFFSLKFRTAYHDLLNSDQGMIRYGQIEFPSVELRYYDDENHLMIEDVSLLKTMSLHPLSYLSRKLSWKFEGTLSPAKDYQCLNCRHVQTTGGIGGSYNLFNRRHIAYLLGTVNAELYSGLPLGYRLGPGIDTGIIFNPSNVKLLAAFQRKWFIAPNSQPNVFVDFAKLAIAYHPKRNLEFRQTGLWTLPANKSYPQHFETFLSVHYFFH